MTYVTNNNVEAYIQTTLSNTVADDSASSTSLEIVTYILFEALVFVATKTTVSHFDSTKFELFFEYHHWK